MTRMLIQRLEQEQLILVDLVNVQKLFTRIRVYLTITTYQFTKVSTDSQ